MNRGGDTEDKRQMATGAVEKIKDRRGRGCSEEVGFTEGEACKQDQR